ncbi:MAG: hypothetical protein R6V06_08475 [Kiritimatiellia bacterium]
MNPSFSALDLTSPLQKAALIIGTAILINAAVLYFAVMPLNRRIEKTKRDTDNLIAENKRIRKVISSANEKKERVAQLDKEHRKMVKEGVLEPLLNSYAMKAKTILAPYTKMSGLNIENVTELPPIPLQQPHPMSGVTYSRQPIEFTTSGSYTQMTSIISYAEKHLPMTALSSLQIKAQNRDPEVHDITFCFEWPVKMETDTLPEK